MQSAAGHSLLGVVPAWVGLAKMSGPMFFKEVEFARGAGAALLLFCGFGYIFGSSLIKGMAARLSKRLGGLLFPDIRRFAPNL